MRKQIIYLLIAAIILIGIYVFLPKSCNENPVIIDNSEQFVKINSLKNAYSELKRKNNIVLLEFERLKQRKDSIIYKVKNQYLTVYDTISQDTINCLPEVYVDSLIVAYEDVIVKADSVIVIKDSLIINLSTSNEVKDTMLVNYKTNEKKLLKRLKREKKLKWFFGGVGLIIGKLL